MNTSLTSRKPRERLQSLGLQTLSTQDLICVLLGSGTKIVSVNVLAQRITKLLEYTTPSELSIDMLLKIKGIGMAKACILLAAFELTERFRKERALSFSSPQTVASHLHELQSSQKEMLIGLYLNARYTLEHKEVLAVGSINQILIYPYEVFSPIKHYPVANIILVHNHPSGDPEASSDDLEFTKRMREAADILGITLIDHIILAKHGVYSCKEHGVL